MRKSDLKTSKFLSGANIVVVGLAREGSAAARFLAEQGARVTVTDARPAHKLAERVAALQGLNIAFVLGQHPDSLLDPKRTDLLVVSPGVPLTAPFLQQAVANGLPLTTESRLFCELCPAPIIGISGSSGKTTTTTLTGLMLKASGITTHVGGNIGQPLIGRLGQIQANDWVVMELSSFQLEYFHQTRRSAACLEPAEWVSGRRSDFLQQGWSPKIGALLNITPNHLDRHKTMAAYTRAKRALVGYMGPEQTAIMGRDNSVTREMGAQISAPVKWFSLNEPVERGACLINGQITLVDGPNRKVICPAAEVKLRGRHNVSNVLAACAIAETAGATLEAMASVAATFTGVQHRLEVVSVQQGVTYINDSIATSPERLIAALKAFTEPVILLAGGKDKDLPWDEAANLILQRVKHLLLFGQAETLILEAIQRQKETGQTNTYRCATLENAVSQAKTLAQPGDVVLLSPGGASFDAYPDFAARGERFRELVIGY